MAGGGVAAPARAAQLLRRNRRSSVEGEIEFMFAHALTQEVAYGQIPARRASGQARAGRGLDRAARRPSR